MLSVSDLKLSHLSLQVSPLVLNNYPSFISSWAGCNNATLETMCVTFKETNPCLVGA